MTLLGWVRVHRMLHDSSFVYLSIVMMHLTNTLIRGNTILLLLKSDFFKSARVKSLRLRTSKLHNYAHENL